MKDKLKEEIRANVNAALNLCKNCELIEPKLLKPYLTTIRELCK